MVETIRFDLDFETTWAYVKDNLDNTNALSSDLIKLVNFSNGKFFTLLPSIVDSKRLHKFEESLNLAKAIKTSDEQTQISGVSRRDPTVAFILAKMRENSELNCIFDDALRSPDNPHLGEIFYNHGISYKNEIYYIVTKNTFSHQLILTCLRKSDSLWHSLGVLTRANLADKTDKTFSLEEIQEICVKTEIAIIGAYDAEAYIIWEKAK